MSPIDRPWTLSRPISRRIVSLPFAFFLGFSMLQAQVPPSYWSAIVFAVPPTVSSPARYGRCHNKVTTNPVASMLGGSAVRRPALRPIFDGAALRGVDFSGANLSGASLKGATFRAMKYDSKTCWPEDCDLRRPT